MKKIFTLLFVLTGFVSAQAQYTVSPTVLNVAGSASEFELVGHAKLYNTGTDTAFTWKRVTNSINMAWSSAICDNVTCWATTVSRNEIYVSPGDSSILDVHTYVSNTSGNGTVQLAVWAGSDSANADTITYNVEAWAVGLEKISQKKELNLYPNPAADQLNLEFQTNEVLQVEIYDVLGKKLRSFTHTGKTSKVKVDDLDPGVYIIRVYESDKTYSRTFRKR